MLLGGHAEVIVRRGLDIFGLGPLDSLCRVLTDFLLHEPLAMPQAGLAHQLGAVGPLGSHVFMLHLVNLAMHKHSRRLQLVAKSRLKQYQGKWIPANQTQNLPHVHQQQQAERFPTINYRDIYIGFTALAFCKWENVLPKNQSETPYSEEGRQLYFKRAKKKRMNARLDEMYSESTSRAVCYSNGQSQ